MIKRKEYTRMVIVLVQICSANIKVRQLQNHNRKKKTKTKRRIFKVKVWFSKIFLFKILNYLP